MKLFCSLALGCLLSLPATLLAQSGIVTKTNPMKVYVHYMPWFQASYTLGAGNWGQHWTMADRNPNVIDSNGEREIASNYYPLIGPYDSSDPYVIEYHMLLMKLCGVDGVIVDWYGTAGSNGDIAPLLSASNKIVSATQTYGLNVGVCLEDRFARSTSDVTTNINYLEQNYATQSNFLKVGASNSPLIPMFGPETEKQPSEWTTILAGVSQKPAMVPLAYQASQVNMPDGSGPQAAVGEMGWVYQDPGTTDFLSNEQSFLANEAGKFSNSLGIAYPGYNDYYQQGGWGSGSGFTIPESNSGGLTLTQTLAQDETYSSNISAVQLATWNDFGEGTMLEPTVQYGFTSLQAIQQFTGVSYGLSQLQLVYELYEARAAFSSNSATETILNSTANDINQLDFPDAKSTLAAAIESAPISSTTLNSMILNGTAAFDLTNRHMIVSYTAGSDPASTIRGYIVSGRNNGAWNGLGIDSSSAAANSAYGIGYADSADLGNPAGLAPSTIEIMYTLLGDANLDGKVNGTDFTLMATNFNKAVSAWDQGDFNYDGAVNGSDFVLLAENFNQFASQSAVSAADMAALESFTGANGLSVYIPEPGSIALVASAMLLIGRRGTRKPLRAA